MTGREKLDILVENGLIVDGTGNVPYHGHVGVLAGRLTVARGHVERAARLRLDATGLVVAPGFIDIHSHSDLDLLANPHAPAKVTQGVTTEVLGVDGLSYAPFCSSEDQAAFVRQNAGIGGASSTRLPWSTIGEQLAHYRGRTAVNTALYVGNSALRVNHIGWGSDTPTAAQLDGMAAELGDAMSEGALGLSTGLDYSPGSYAQTSELVRLASVVADRGGTYHTHVRYGLGDQFFDPFREALQISRMSGCALHITHFSKSGRDPGAGGAVQLLDLVDEARAEGLDVTFDTYPYEWGGTRLSRLLPAWIQEGHPDHFEDRLRDPSMRRRAAREVEESAAARAYVMSRPFADLRLTNLSAECDSEFEGRYLAEVVAANGNDLGETVCALVGRNPAASFTRPSPHALTLGQFVCHPAGAIATDGIVLGKAHSPRAFGSFARVLGEFVRDERQLTLADAIRKMTLLPATILGLRDRGMLADGMAADVTVFDPTTVQAHANYEHPRASASGIVHVLVNGVPVLHEGCLLESMPGQGIGPL